MVLTSLVSALFQSMLYCSSEPRLLPLRVCRDANPWLAEVIWVLVEGVPKPLCTVTCLSRFVSDLVAGVFCAAVGAVFFCDGLAGGDFCVGRDSCCGCDDDGVCDLGGADSGCCCRVGFGGCCGGCWAGCGCCCCWVGCLGWGCSGFSGVLVFSVSAPAMPALRSSSLSGADMSAPAQSMVSSSGALCPPIPALDPG